VDGDTIDVLLDLGFDSYRRERLRLARVNTPELREPHATNCDVKKAKRINREDPPPVCDCGAEQEREAAKVAKEFVENALLDAEGFPEVPMTIKSWPLRIVTTKTGKYGRYLAEVYYQKCLVEAVDPEAAGEELEALHSANPVEVHLNQRLLDEGHAKLYDGGKRCASRKRSCGDSPATSSGVSARAR
jgi:endonuclease YncB( thermonuclease family)